MITEKETLIVEMDTGVKSLASQILERMGIDQTTAINMFYRQIIAERKLPFQPVAAQTHGEQLLDIIKRKGIPNVTLTADANGHAYIDKDKHPDIYDWAVNG